MQDGAFLTTTYPNHPFSQLLLHLMQSDNYKEWVEQVKGVVREREVIHEENIMEDRKFEAVLRTVEKIITVDQKINDLTAAIMRRNEVGPPSGGLYHFHASLDASNIPRQAREEIKVNMQMAKKRMLIPTVPIIPPNVHKTIAENMEFWIERQLWVYMDRGDQSLKQMGWDLKTQFRFCKRRDIAVWVKVVAETVLDMELDWCEDRHILLDIARFMDEERGKNTVLNSLSEFKKTSNLSWMKKRKK